MEEQQKDDELARFHKKKRKRKKILLLTISIVFIIVALIFLGKYCKSNQKHSVKYTENSDINYGINLLDNEFYKTNHIGENVDVISNLIKDIEVEFKYNLNLFEERDYIYSYKIIANVELKEKTKTNLIYSDEQVVMSKEQSEGNSKRLEIYEKMNIVYNEYDNQINKLIEQYRLDNTISELTVSMNLNVVDKATGERINKDSNVMSINIPLDTKTVEITINENANNSQGEFIIKEKEDVNSGKYLTIAVLMFISGFLNIIWLIKYIIKTRSAEKMYEKELNKILFDYKSYVQQIVTPLDYSIYKIIKINTFLELLQMREDIQSPILMYTEKNNLKTIFMIIKDDLLFTYILSSKSIRKRLIEESKKKKGMKENEQNK